MLFYVLDESNVQLRNSESTFLGRLENENVSNIMGGLSFHKRHGRVLLKGLRCYWGSGQTLAVVGSGWLDLLYKEMSKLDAHQSCSTSDPLEQARRQDENNILETRHVAA